MRLSLRTIAFLCAAGVLAPTAVRAQEPALPTISRPGGRPLRRLPPSVGRPVNGVIENGLECTTVTFEGLADEAAVPTINGINSPGWLSLIDEDAGGSGNFANEPTPETIMFWLGSNPSIVLDRPATKMSFYYSTSVTLTVTAFNDQNVQIAQITRPANYQGGPGDPNGTYSGWAPLEVQVSGQKIKRLTVVGGPNYTGFDNLKVCSSIGVDSVEMTQAIQQWQSIADLKADLQGDREPPVPLVAGKPAVMRVYMQQIGSVTPVTVEVSGAINASRVVALQPQCTVEKQRLRQDGCVAADFYFTPTAGNFDLTVQVRDATNAITEVHQLPLTARETNALKLKAVSVCDDQDGNGNWLCGAASVLANSAGVLRKIAPTRSVTVETTSSQVRLLTSAYADIDAWWDATTAEIANLHGIFDWASGALGTTVKYYGMIRPALPGGTGGMAHDIPGDGAASRTSVTRLGVETNTEVVAHETGHALGLRHTNTDVPSAASVPGCYNLAADSSTNWPFANNRIQSAARLEVGYDVVAQRPLDPQNTFDIMSYCVPRWISPQRYKTLITSLSGGAVSSPSGTTGPQAVGDAWLVSGVIASGAAQIDPLFAIQAELQAGLGTHVVNVLDAGSNVLASSRFTPAAPATESSDAHAPGLPRFRVVLPKPAGAARLEVRSDTNTLLGSVTIAGAAPAVQLLSPSVPGVLSGPVLISWLITDADSASHTTRVQYSKDGGQAWSNLAVTTADDVVVDFDKLPGGVSTSLRLLVSDGANSTTATFGPFSTPRKGTVTAAILPTATNVVAAAGQVFLEGVGADIDDGTLVGTKLSWSSSLAGPLGTGERIGVTLAPGSHVVSLTATDSDGNQTTAQTTVNVAGAPPQVALSVVAANTLPTTCMAATIALAPGSAPATVVEYSLNGGAQWTAVPVNALPYRFIVPGSGYFSMIARAFDAAAQSTAAGDQFFTGAACTQQVVVTPPAWNPSAAASSLQVSVLTATSAVAWTSSSNASWLTASPAGGTGSAVVTLTAAATTSAHTRTATVTIAGSSVLVTQAAGVSTFVVTPPSWAVGNDGGTRQVQLTSSLVDAPWTSSSSAAWLTATPATGVGSTAVTLTAAANSGATRTATMTIAGQTVSVTQGTSGPSGLRVTRVDGSQVTMQWAYDGPATAGFVLAAGLGSGQTVVAVPTGSASPIVTLAAPPGRFYVRVHLAEDVTRQSPSNEVVLVVGVPEAPSAPSGLLGTSAGSRLDLTWTNTFEGGAPAGVTLLVSGAVSAALPLGLTDRFSFQGVPPGTYSFSVVASNGAGTSAPSSPVTLTFPITCSGAPLPPTRFLAYRTGNTVSVVWEPAQSGPAPTDFILRVSEFGLSIPTGGARTVSGAVGAGSYTLSVAATNSCGNSAYTATQTLVVP